jgi:hypothetical protein
MFPQHSKGKVKKNHTKFDQYRDLAETNRKGKEKGRAENKNGSRECASISV